MCCLQLTAAIINRPSTKEDGLLGGSRQVVGNSYLNQQRPLWILEDQVPQSDYADLVYTTQSPYNYQMQQMQPQQQTLQHSNQVSQSNRVAHHQSHAMSVHQQQQLHPQQSTRTPHLARPQSQRTMQQSRAYKYSPRLQLPRRYLPLQYVRFQQRLRPQLARKQPRFIATDTVIPTRRRENYIPRISMPTFDSMPGDESDREPPVFIYTGPKGQLILNTILTAPKYPMQEPVPGQVLYPPTVPIFRPKPIVERFRLPGSTDTLNLTLIPFYAHEAIDMSQASRMLGHEQALNQEATTVQPSVVYAAPAVMPPTADSATDESAPPTKKFRTKKGKLYSAYHSPNEVQWTPMTPDQLKLITSTTTPYPLTAPSPLQNHRFPTDLEVSSTTPPSFVNYKISYKSDTDSVEDAVEEDELLMHGDQLDIIYVDDSLEKPTAAPTKPSTLSSRYSLSKEYYAFPVFTLGKLLRSETEKTEKPLRTFMVENTFDSALENAQQEREELVTQANAVSDNIGAERNVDGDEDDVETWFILNSRYKGQHSLKNNEYRLSSKYIHTTDVREPNDSNL
ncbi:uncharacterized protein LOC129238436 [Anastrepha obliqua]|uniref:uncharacterized protein LOC129238436 n=1 Tax=Anastrepha obliqua TaxID=95512 RepID=UPI00240957DB|nr:uncharacterized protein LOC129238436 [Anastrepha obliqua]